MHKASTRPAGGSALFTPGRIGNVRISNRLVRAGTSETMAGPDGAVTSELIDLYEVLARTGVGLIITGHLYCHPRGRYADGQTGIDRDELVPGLRRLVSSVHRHGAKIFAELGHAGSQSRLPDVEPVAPSAGRNDLTGRVVDEATEEEIEQALAAYVQGAHRAFRAGFDGVHLHGTNGYLISEFCSPRTNRRTDRWGGSAEARDRFGLEVVRQIRAVVPPGKALTMKIGIADLVPAESRLEPEEALARARRLAEAGLDAIEVSPNVTSRPTDSVRKFVGVGRPRAARDLLASGVIAGPSPEAYFLDWAQMVRGITDVPLILVGGIRRRETMEALLGQGVVDYVALARPFIRQPDLAQRLREGLEVVSCTSCNLCLVHSGRDQLRCWRTPRRRLLQHGVARLRRRL